MAVIAGLVIGVIALFGWRAWGDYKETRAAEASALYAEFQLGLNNKDNAVLETLQQQFITDYASTPYASLVQLALAKKAVEEDDTGKAKSYLQWVLDNSKQPQTVAIARARMAAVLINDKDHDAALAVLTVKDPGGYAAVYNELRGDALLAKGDRAAAHDAYNKALQSDGLSPAGRDIIVAKLADTTVAPAAQAEAAK